MCRLLGYLGPPVALSSLVIDPPHSLLRQSWAPRRQAHGVVNADGFGVGWYAPAVRPEPVLYRSDKPMWADRNIASLAPAVSSGAVLAAVRSATPPLPVVETNSPPFGWGRWLFAHNGAVAGPLGPLRRALSDEQLGALEGSTDSEVLFRLALDRVGAGLSMADALGQVAGMAQGRLTMMMTDGQSVAAVVCGEPLYRRGCVLASEPYDDEDGWAQLADGTVEVLG
jgi:glutamine amidotransferase